MNYQGKSALITGASSGIGETFARALSQRGAAVLLAALPADSARLETLAAELRSHHGARAEFVALDLAERGAPARLQARADELGFEPDLIVNCAGVGVTGPFGEVPLERQLLTVQINIEALVALVGLYVPRMVARRQGAVINIASTAALRPLPYFNVYAASKAFVLSFSQALWAELHQYGVRVVTLCPGPVANTGFNSPEQMSLQRRRIMKRRYLSREDVVESALSALEHDRPVVIRRIRGARVLSAVVTLLGSLLPLRLQLRLTERICRNVFSESHWSMAGRL
jgi:short-subunit dehydrogenase